MNEFDQQLFTPLDRSEKTGLGSETETIAFWSDVWRRFRRNIPALTGIVIISLFVLFAIIGPAMVPYRYDKVNLFSTYQPPVLGLACGPISLAVSSSG